ncbi:MAG: phospholipase D family protein [Aureliella sp.]
MGDRQASKKQWSNVSYLDALRPNLGWQVDYALLASYSADMIAVVATMLALAGLDDDRGSGSKVDFANAIERLGGKFRLVVQSGRLFSPRKAPNILGVLDQFIRTVSFDEKTQSWHPKIALVKTREDASGEIEWRLWIGSRNLTRDISWDVSLTLIGRPSNQTEQADGAKPIDGVVDLARSLAARGELDGVSPDSIAAELSNVRWRCPNGCDVESIRLHDHMEQRTLPPSPVGLKRLLVISPFLDGTLIKTLSAWGTNETKRTLLSSKCELLKLAGQGQTPLDGFDSLLMMGSPDPDELVLSNESVESEDEEPEPRGLHAKIIIAEHAAGTTMWTGSANATVRGWAGPNAEVIARATISPEVLEGVWAFVKQSATTVERKDLEESPEVDEPQERLDRARSEVAASWSVTQTIANLIPVLNANADPNAESDDFRLEVASLSGPWIGWPRGEKQVSLTKVSLADVSELIACRLSLGDLQTTWLQRCPLDPHPGMQRDQQALARYLDPKTFFESVRGLLVGATPGDGGGRWDGTTKNAAYVRSQGPAWWSPTLEEVLKAWGRDPSSLLEVDRKVKYYLDLYRQRDGSDITDDERAVVADFEQVWSVVRSELVSKP